jgi:2-aminoethylphosphonate-pyruvate transaminase
MTLANSIDLVIFDWAGTTVDFGCRAPVNALREAFARRGVELSEPEIRRDMGKSKADHVHALLKAPRIDAAWTAAHGAAPAARDCAALIADLGPLMREQAAHAATLIEGTRATVDALRAAGVKIASSTGYTRAMMEPVLASAASQGYAPDHVVCSGETAQGRPSPLMIYKACTDLGVWPLSRVVKVDDTEAGVAEGRSAGCITVGVAASGNSVGLSTVALAGLPAKERDARVAAAGKSLRAAGANFVIDTVADLLPALERYLAGLALQRCILLTPGPLTTTAETRAAMLADWGSWDGAFNALTASVCRDLVAIVEAPVAASPRVATPVADSPRAATPVAASPGPVAHVCVPLQGSGTFAVEAALGTLVPRSGKVLVPDNGSYCKRIARILTYLGRAVVSLPHGEQEPANPARIDAALQADPQITHVAQVHCETGTGILNPLPQIASVVARHGRGLIIDAMSSFGAIPIDAASVPFDALIAASGKCLEGVPGMGFVIARRAALERSVGNSASLAMDLFDQWQYMQKTGQWRFTPPTHVVAALRAAIDQYQAQGGLEARLARYSENCQALVSGMRALGFETFLPDALQAPIIVTFHAPPDPAYDFAEFYARVRAGGFLLYPGKLTAVDTFRVGCIGAIRADTLRQAVAAIAHALNSMGVRRLAPD